MSVERRTLKSVLAFDRVAPPTWNRTLVAGHPYLVTLVRKAVTVPRNALWVVMTALVLVPESITPVLLTVVRRPPCRVLAITLPLLRLINTVWVCVILRNRWLRLASVVTDSPFKLIAQFEAPVAKASPTTPSLFVLKRIN